MGVFEHGRRCSDLSRAIACHFPFTRFFSRPAALIHVDSDTRIRPWNAVATKSRRGGDYYDDMWKVAVEIAPPVVSITSTRRWVWVGLGWVGFGCVIRAQGDRWCLICECLSLCQRVCVYLFHPPCGGSSLLQSLVPPPTAGFNEWHEGTQIEPSISKSTATFFDKEYDYEDFEPHEPGFYMDKTRDWCRAYRTAKEN